MQASTQRTGSATSELIDLKTADKIGHEVANIYVGIHCSGDSSDEGKCKDDCKKFCTETFWKSDASAGDCGSSDPKDDNYNPSYKACDLCVSICEDTCGKECK
ncbi:MAG TPA: hypothetical protein ENG50_02800 [Candidatus Altiarchaeales archaeon]|nr:hypothetical protein [Candidatus Altiarchaeales archaeon]